MKLAPATLISIGALGWLAMPALATDRHWTGATSMYWSDAGNWNPAGVPANGDNLFFDASGANKGMMNNLPNLAVGSLAFISDDTPYKLDGNALTVNSQLWTDPSQSNVVTLKCPLHFPTSATVTAYAEVAGPGETKANLYLDGPITIDSGQVTIQAHAQKGASGSQSGHIYILGPVSGAGNLLVEADEDGGIKGSVEFDEDPFLVPQDGSLTGTFALRTIGSAEIILHQGEGQSVNQMVSVLNGDTANIRLWPLNQEGTTFDVEAGSHLVFRGSAEFTSIAGLKIRSFSTDTQPCVVDTSGLPWLGLGNIDVQCDNNNQTPVITGNLNLGYSESFDIHGTASPGLEIAAAVEGGGFKKKGNSTLVLSGANTFSGEVEVDEGELEVRNSSALGSPTPDVNGPADTVLAGGSLKLNAPIYEETLVAKGQSIGGDLPGSLLTVVHTNSWYGPVVLNTNIVVVGGDMYFGGQISGTGGLGLFNDTTIFTIPVNNTYTGTTLVRCALLELNRAANTTNFAGPLVVGGAFGGPYEVRWLDDDQCVGVALTLYANGLVNLNNHSDTLGSITFNGGTVETGFGQLAIDQPVTVNPDSATAVLNGNLNLPAGDARVVNVSDGAADPDLLVNASLSGTPTYFVKQGAGTMRLAGANAFFAATLLEGGILDANNTAALGTAGCVIFNGATLRINVNGTIPNNFEAVGAGAAGTHGAFESAGGTAVTLSGSILLDTNTTFKAGSAGGITLSGAISGSGPLTKIGHGYLYFSGSAYNSYLGNTVVTAGLLELGRNPNVVCVPGDLVIGPASADSPAEARINQLGGFNGPARVTVNANSVFNLNNDSETLSQLNLNDGGSVSAGNGTLNFTSGAAVSVGSLNSGIAGGSHVSASIQGNIGIPPNASGLSFNVRAYANSFPFDSRPELDLPDNIFVNAYEDPNHSQTGISKSGSGRMRLGGSNVYKGLTFLNGGTLLVEGSISQSAVVVDGGTLKGTGLTGPIFLTSASSTVAPGDGPGILTCGNFDNGGGSGRMLVELNGTTPGSGYGQLNVRGSVNLNGVALSGSLNFAASTNSQFTIINNDGTDPCIACSKPVNVQLE